jgi:hypothetical protein
MLRASNYLLQKNTGKDGAGVLTAVSNSNVVMKGVNVDNNKGVNGGALNIKESQLSITLSMFAYNEGLGSGGFLYAFNSYFNIDDSTVIN